MVPCPSESVAGFVGHRNPKVTSDVYIAMSQSQRRQMVDCPWLRGLPKPEDDVRARGRETALAIGSPFGSADGRTFPTELPQRAAAPTTEHARVCEQLAAYLREHNIMHHHNHRHDGS